MVVLICARQGQCDINVRMAKTMKHLQGLLLLGLTGLCFTMVEA